MAAIAVDGVADQMMGDVVEMLANLVVATGFGAGAYKRVARAGIRPNGDWQLYGRQALELGAGRAWCGFATWSQVVIDQPGKRAMAAGNGQIGFFDLAFSEQGRKPTGTLGAQGKNQHAGGRAVESVDWVDASSKLVSQKAHGDFMIAVEIAGVNG